VFAVSRGYVLAASNVRSGSGENSGTVGTPALLSNSGADDSRPPSKPTTSAWRTRPVWKRATASSWFQAIVSTLLPLQMLKPTAIWSSGVVTGCEMIGSLIRKLRE